MTGVQTCALPIYYKLPAWRWLDIVAPGVFVMQAAGRLGNFFNQELYGPPTTLPWGIAIDCAHRVVEYPCATFPLITTHFHPLFLYESLSGLLGAAVLVWLSRRSRPWLRTGDSTAILFIWIGGVRFLVEFLRIGNWRLGDIPTAQYFGATFVLIGLAILFLRRRQGAPPLVTEAASTPAEPDEPGEPDESGEAEERAESAPEAVQAGRA